jgi:hypothetical protein
MEIGWNQAGISQYIKRSVIKTKFRTVYRHGRKYVVPIRTTRQITRRDRRAFSKNARRGERVWERMTPRQRRRARTRNAKNKSTSWGFKGKSPRTRDI